MSTDKTPQISSEDRWAVAEKLQTLRDAMTPGEQAVIDTLFEIFVTEASGRTIGELLVDLPDKTELLDDVAEFMLEGPAGVAARPIIVIPTTNLTRDCVSRVVTCPTPARP